MKINQWLITASIAVMVCSGASNVLAQGGPGGFGGGNFDPAQFQQMMMDNYQQQLELTNNEEWNAVKPLIQKVVDARQAAGAFGGRGGRGGRGGFGGGPGGGGRGGFGGPPNPTVEALQTAIDSGSTDQIKAAIAKYREGRKQAEAKLTAAQDELKKVLTIKQEAVALRMGLVN